MPHPWHWHWHRPSRLLWFAFGAMTGAWFMKHKECADNYKVKHCSRHQIPQEAYPPPQGQGAAQSHDWHAQWHNRWRERQQQQQQQWPQQQNQETSPPTNVSATATDQPVVTVDGWDEERQRLLKIKQQAANSVSMMLSVPDDVLEEADLRLQLLDFSEEGLDSLLTSMEALKAVSISVRFIYLQHILLTFPPSWAVIRESPNAVHIARKRPAQPPSAKLTSSSSKSGNESVPFKLSRARSLSPRNLQSASCKLARILISVTYNLPLSIFAFVQVLTDNLVDRLNGFASPLIQVLASSWSLKCSIL
jgi:hypothetical protein